MFSLVEETYKKLGIWTSRTTTTTSGVWTHEQTGVNTLKIWKRWWRNEWGERERERETTKTRQHACSGNNDRETIESWSLRRRGYGDLRPNFHRLNSPVQTRPKSIMQPQNRPNRFVLPFALFCLRVCRVQVQSKCPALVPCLLIHKVHRRWPIFICVYCGLLLKIIRNSNNNWWYYS